MAMSRYNTIGENYLEMERKKVRAADVAACLCILMILGVGFCFAFFTGVRGSDLLTFCYVFGGSSMLFAWVLIHLRYRFRKYFLCTVSVQLDGITLHSHRGNPIRTLRFSECRGGMMEIDTVLHTEKYRAAFSSTLECLVLYRNEDAIAYCINDTTHLLSYGALMKSEDAIVIHNRKAIKAIREQCAEFLARSGITVSEEKKPLRKEPAREQFGQAFYLLYEEYSEHPLRSEYRISMAMIGIGIFVSLFSVIEMIWLAVSSLFLVAGGAILGEYFYLMRLYRYAVVGEKGVSVFSYKGERLQTYMFSDLKAVRKYCMVDVGNINSIDKKCLVVYRNLYFPRKEDFFALWKNEDVLVTCNPALMELLESCLSPEQILEECS